MRISRALILLIAIAAAACASPYYKGIDLRDGMAPTDVQALARRAYAGDKEAQYLLGQRLEAGNGVGQDLEQAEALYRGAANDKGGTRWIYVPRSGPVDARNEQFEKPVTPGSVSASTRLLELTIDDQAADTSDKALEKDTGPANQLAELSFSQFALDRNLAAVMSSKSLRD